MPRPPADPRELAHELRGALNSITAWSGVLEHHLRNAPPAAARALEGIRLAVQHQLAVIERSLEDPPAGRPGRADETLSPRRPL